MRLQHCGGADAGERRPDRRSAARNRRLKPTDLQLDGWLPHHARWRDGALWTDWARLGAEPLDPAFFEHSVARMLGEPFNRLFQFQAPETVLRQRAETHHGVTPTGFVFHMSRCGSTLVSRLLGALAQTIVLSEAAPIDTVLKGAVRAPMLKREELATRLRWMVAALAQPRRGDEQRLFVKLDAWQMCAWPLIAAAFPQTPWVFLYRDPVEVLVSQIDEAGSQFIPGAMPPELLGLSEAVDPTATCEVYGAQVLGCICKAAIARFTTGGGLLINYRRLPQAFDAIAAHFGVELDAAFRCRADAIVRLDAKRDGLHFAPDCEAKRERATPELRAAAERWAAPPYSELERLSGAPES